MRIPDDHRFLDLPAPLLQPCNDCPWRREAAPGWLGPHTAEEWARIAHSEEPVACHQTIPPGSEGMDPEEVWEDPRIRQCTGMGIFRNNICKRPWNPTDAERFTTADHERVFSWDDQFIAHHTRYQK